MNFIRALYEQSSYDDLILQLKQAFGKQVAAVSVNTLVPDQLLEFQWEDLLDPNDLAAQMTEALPNIIFETSSNTGIDTCSRYFNATQLW